MPPPGVSPPVRRQAATLERQPKSPSSDVPAAAGSPTPNDLMTNPRKDPQHDVLSQLLGKVRREQYETWFRSLRLQRCDDREMEFSVTSQFVRDWLEESGWNKEPPAPELPADVVARTVERYQEAARRLTGGGTPLDFSEARWNWT